MNTIIKTTVLLIIIFFSNTILAQEKIPTRTDFNEKLQDIFYNGDLPYNFTVKYSNGDVFISSMNEFFLSRIRITFENKEYYWDYYLPDEAINNFKVTTTEKRKEFSVVQVKLPFTIDRRSHRIGVMRQFVEPVKVDEIYFFVPNHRVDEFHTLITGYLNSPN